MDKVIDQIEIKGIFKKQTIQILSNKVQVIKKSVTDFLEYEIPLDQIDAKKIVKTESNNNLVALGFLIAVAGLVVNAAGASVIFGFMLIFAFLLIIIGLFRRKKTITIASYSSAPIVLEFKKRNEKEVRTFADKLIRHTKEYLIKKYSRVDRDLPLENQLNGIEFLRSNDLISDSEFEKLKNKLLGKNSKSGSLGF